MTLNTDVAERGTLKGNDLVIHLNCFSGQVGLGTFEAHLAHCRHWIVGLMVVVRGKYSKGG